MESAERVLALDLSSQCVGWAVFDNGELVTYGRYRQCGESHGEKLATFDVWLIDLLKWQAPTHVVVEAPYAGRVRHTYGILMLYVGKVLEQHFRHFGEEMPKHHLVPAHLVKRILGVKKGTSHEQNKKRVLLLINQLYGLSLKFKSNDRTKRVSEDDTADAIALNRAWWLRYRPGVISVEVDAS
jgi:hypothetical protein